MRDGLKGRREAQDGLVRWGKRREGGGLNWEGEGPGKEGGFCFLFLKLFEFKLFSVLSLKQGEGEIQSSFST